YLLRLGKLIVAQLLQKLRLDYLGFQEGVAVAQDLDLFGYFTSTHVLIGGDNAFFRYFLAGREIACAPLKLRQQASRLVEIEGEFLLPLFRDPEAEGRLAFHLDLSQQANLERLVFEEQPLSQAHGIGRFLELVEQLLFDFDILSAGLDPA